MEVPDIATSLKPYDVDKFYSEARPHLQSRIIMKKPYGRLVVEETSNLDKLIDVAGKVYLTARELQREETSLTRLFELAGDDFYLLISPEWKSELFNYRQSIQRLEDFRKILLQNETVRMVADVSSKFGDLVVSGGEMIRAIIGEHEDSTEFSSDIDAITECSLDDFEKLYAELKEKFSENADVKVTLSEGRVPKIVVQDNRENIYGGKGLVIDIVPSEFFANKAREVASVLGENLDYGSDLELMLVRWPSDAKSQIAVNLKNSKRVLNGGKPMLWSNVFDENPLSYTTWQTMRKLQDKGRSDLAEGLLKRAIGDLERLPKSAGKRINPHGIDLYRFSNELTTNFVSLGEFLVSDDEKYKKSIRQKASENLTAAVDTGTVWVWGLSDAGFDGLFSETLLFAQGFTLHQEGEKIGERYIRLPDKDDNASWQKLDGLNSVLIEVGILPGVYNLQDNYCRSITEYFAIEAGFAMANNEVLEKIAEEIQMNWSNENMPFDSQKFLTWSKEIRDAILGTEIQLDNFYEIEIEDDGNVYFKYFPDSIEKDKIIVDAIRNTEFWKERTIDDN